MTRIFLSGVVFDQSLECSWQSLDRYLSVTEQYELARRNYRSDLRRSQFVYGRLLLKLLLVREMNLDFGLINILSSGRGEPLLFQRDSLVEAACLSIAHHRNLVFVSAGFNCRCGVDVQSIHRIDWNAVLRVMGWSISNDSQWVGIGLEPNQDQYLSPQARCCLIWSAYEAWLKLHSCQLPPTEFSWHHIRSLETDTFTHAQIFEMVLHDCGLYDKGRILLMLYSDEVFAVATYVY